MPEAMQIEDAACDVPTEEEKQSESKWWLVGLGAWAAVSTVAAILFFVLWMCAPGSGQNLGQNLGQTPASVRTSTVRTMQWYAHSFDISTNEAAQHNTDLCAAAMENILKVSDGKDDSMESLCVMWDTQGKCSYKVANSKFTGEVWPGTGEALWVVHNLCRNPADVTPDKCPKSWEQQVIAFGDGMTSFLSNDAVMPFRFVLPDHLDKRMHDAGAHEKCMQAAGFVNIESQLFNKFSEIEFRMVVSGLNLLKAALFDKPDKTGKCKSVETMKKAIDGAATMKIGGAAAVKTAGQKLSFKPSVWDDIVWFILSDLIFQKFTNHRVGAYEDLLKATGDFILAEALSTETVFAVNLEVGSAKLQKVSDWPAAPNTNMQGAALMQLRLDLQYDEEHKEEDHGSV